MSLIAVVDRAAEVHPHHLVHCITQCKHDRIFSKRLVCLAALPAIRSPGRQQSHLHTAFDQRLLLSRAMMELRRIVTDLDFSGIERTALYILLCRSAAV